MITIRTKQQVFQGESLEGTRFLNVGCDPVDVSLWAFTTCIKSGSLEVGGTVTKDPVTHGVTWRYYPDDLKTLCPGTATLFIYAQNLADPTIRKVALTIELTIVRGCC